MIAKAPAGTNVTFTEGLVTFHGKWFAYYGQSDTTLAVAVADPAVWFGEGCGPTGDARGRRRSGEGEQPFPQ